MGTIVGQIGKIFNCRVIGLAGTTEKCNWLTKELNFDIAINYKTEDVEDSLKAAAPNGIDVYYDNVGGDISALIMSQMNDFGRVALCGSISTYNSKSTKGKRFEFHTLSKMLEK